MLCTNRYDTDSSTARLLGTLGELEHARTELATSPGVPVLPAAPKPKQMMKKKKTKRRRKRKNEEARNKGQEEGGSGGRGKEKEKKTKAKILFTTPSLDWAGKRQRQGESPQKK